MTDEITVLRESLVNGLRQKYIEFCTNLHALPFNKNEPALLINYHLLDNAYFAIERLVMTMPVSIPSADETPPENPDS